MNNLDNLSQEELCRIGRNCIIFYKETEKAYAVTKDEDESCVMSGLLGFFKLLISMALNEGATKYEH